MKLNRHVNFGNVAWATSYFWKLNLLLLLIPATAGAEYWSEIFKGPAEVLPSASSQVYSVYIPSTTSVIITMREIKSKPVTVEWGPCILWSKSDRDESLPEWIICSEADAVAPRGLLHWKIRQLGFASDWTIRWRDPRKKEK